MSPLFTRIVLLLLSILSLPVFAEGTEKTVRAANVVTDPVNAGSLMQLLLGMFAVLLLIIGLAWVFRRLGGLQTAVGKELRIIGGLSMGARERLVLVQVGEKQLLLGVAPGRIQTLYELQQPIQPAVQHAPVAGSFAEKLAASMKQAIKK